MTGSRNSFPGVSDADWGDWRWQQRHMLRTATDLERLVHLTTEERRGLEGSAGRFRVGATPYYASLMDPASPGLSRADAGDPGGGRGRGDAR